MYKWIYTLYKDETTVGKPIKMVQLLPVQSVQVHAGPVTCLTYTGTTFTHMYKYICMHIYVDIYVDIYVS
jgi:hypothetical protein